MVFASMIQQYVVIHVSSPHARTDKLTHLHARAHTYTRTRTHTHKALIHTRTYIHVHTHTYRERERHTHTHAHTHTRTHTRTHTHTHTHTWPHGCGPIRNNRSNCLTMLTLLCGSRAGGWLYVVVGTGPCPTTILSTRGLYTHARYYTMSRVCLRVDIYNCRDFASLGNSISAYLPR